MQSKIGPKRIKALPVEVIKNLFNKAFSHRDIFVKDALTCGQSLIEQRQEMAQSHGGTGFIVDVSEAEPDSTFENWAAQICDAKSRTTLYRWMAAAERVIKFLLNKQPGDPCPTTLLSDDGYVLISQVLIGSADFLKALPAGTQSFRDQFDAFLQDKTLSAVSIGALEGQVNPHDITLAANGKKRGGTNKTDDRTDTPYFTAQYFQTFSTRLERWDILPETQRTEIKGIVHAAILGDEVQLANRQRAAHFQFTPWPEELRAIAREAIREAGRKAKTKDEE